MKLILRLIETLLICLVATAVLFLAASLGNAEDFKFVEVQEVTVNYKSYFPNGYEPLISDNGLPDRQLDKELTLRVNTNFLKYLYWNNYVHSWTDKTSTGGGQFRLVGYQFDLGIQITSFVSLEYAHHSQHLLDHQLPNRFPVNDSISLNLFLFSIHPKKGLLGF